jgi:hypothetical protein
MEPIPLIAVPIGAANLHQMINWLITQINLQFDNLATAEPQAPEAFSLTVSMVRTPPPQAEEEPAPEPAPEGYQERPAPEGYQER